MIMAVWDSAHFQVLPQTLRVYLQLKYKEKEELHSKICVYAL